MSSEFESPEKALTSGTASQLFPLPWSHYVCLLAVKREDARSFYEQEAIRGGWSLRPLKRQVESQFFERTALSKNKAAMLAKGQKARPEDTVTLEEQINDPNVLEFMDLKAQADPPDPFVRGSP